jgi:DNA-directed RNA polymerase
MIPSFDELMKLAQQDPDKLESLRQSWVEDAIEGAPEMFQRRLRGLQFQIDMEREKASNPASSCVKISQMMHEGLANLHEAINQKTVSQKGHQPPIANIIQFPSALVE